MTRVLSVEKCTENETDIQVLFEVDGTTRELIFRQSQGGTSAVLTCSEAEIKKYMGEIRLGESLEFKLDFMEKVFPGIWWNVWGGWVCALMHEENSLMKFVDHAYRVTIGKDVLDFLCGWCSDRSKVRYARLNGQILFGTEPK